MNHLLANYGGIHANSNRDSRDNSHSRDSHALKEKTNQINNQSQQNDGLKRTYTTNGMPPQGFHKGLL